MTFDVEMMLRHDPRVFTEQIRYDTEPRAWTKDDVDAVLKKVLRAVEHVLDPAEAGDRLVSLRGVNWIVSPHAKGVVIAIEIHSASVVAGPFDIPQADLERLMARVFQAAQPRTTVH